jgi:hypothetical protein
MKVAWIALTAVGITFSGDATAQDDASEATWATRFWMPTPAQVARIERGLRLPTGADPLQTYERYYTGTYKGSRRLVLGALVGLQKLPREGSLAIVKPAEMPAIADAGCGVIWLTYDLAAQKVRSIRCNPDGPMPPRAEPNGT